MSERKGVTFYLACREHKLVARLGSEQVESFQKLYPNAEWKKIALPRTANNLELEELIELVFNDESRFNKTIKYAPKQP